MRLELFELLNKFRDELGIIADLSLVDDGSVQFYTSKINHFDEVGLWKERYQEITGYVYFFT